MPVYRHLTNTKQLDRAWIESELLPLSDELRNGRNPDRTLDGQNLYCLFYEPSFLTRTSFERAAGLLGGEAHHTEDASQFFPVHTPSYIDNIINILGSLKIDLVVLRAGDDEVVARAAATDAMPVVNGGSSRDHPTQALADLYSIRRELGQIDGTTVAVVGRLEHRNVNALLKGLAMFEGVRVIMVPFSGQVPDDVVEHCKERGLKLETHKEIDAVSEADAIYLNGPRTVAHMQLLRSRNSGNLRIDQRFMAMLKPHCVIMDPMQRSGDFSIEVEDQRLAFYRQAENALYARMAVIRHLLG